MCMYTTELFCAYQLKIAQDFSMDRLFESYRNDMAQAGIQNPDITARRLALAYNGAYQLTLAVGQPVDLPMLPHIPADHQPYVQAWMRGLRERIMEAIEEEWNDYIV